MFVPVVDQDQHPLMPTTAARAKRWIKRGKATAFWKGGIFCVRMNVEPSAREIQPIAVGIGPGSKREGYSVISAAHTYLNIQAEARAGVKHAEQLSAQMRKLAALQLMQGYQTKALRVQLGLKKSGKKLAEVWEAHAVDACIAISQGNSTRALTRSFNEYSLSARHNPHHSQSSLRSPLEY